QAEAQQEVTRRQTELAGLEAARKEQELVATTVKPAAAEAQAAIQRAEGEKRARIAAAEAGAEAERLQGSAEAAVVLTKGEAEAKALAMRADAYKLFNDAAIIQTVLAALPEIVRAAAEPMQHIDSLTVMSADGASEIVKNTSRVVAESATAIKGLTGMDVPALIGAAMRSGNVGRVTASDGEGGAHPAASTPTVVPPTPATPAPSAQHAPADAAASTTDGAEALEDEAARHFAQQLRGMPNVGQFAGLKLSEVSTIGPRPLRLLWQVAEPQIARRYGSLTVGELMQRFGGQTAKH
ncbi:MAG TPA: flotillin domain-containing protein, partial [Candidatus Limnocylindria bacterium]|nr:flotillin domain-containing protein [Candidatus Limnocylindria bacterium]